VGYKLLLLADMYEQLGEIKLIEILSQFSCPLNKDVESFLHDKAITLDKQSVSRTHLVFSDFRDKVVLIAYFTLANKYLIIPRKNLTSNYRKRMQKFALEDEDKTVFKVPSPLIGQMSKNFTNAYNKLIPGDELLKIALDKVKEAQKIIGGKYVYLECEDKPSLIRFYRSNGFWEFGKRQLDRDETGLSGDYLIQMLKYMD
jgi:hypothetical protein